MIKISRGLDIPIAGAPDQKIEAAPAARAVAMLGDDYVGMKPTMAVQEGDRVKRGQPLFSCKKSNGVVYTAPAGGTVSAGNRGARRVLQSVVIDIDGENEEAVSFASYDAHTARTLDRATVRAQLAESGQWSALRTRPFSQVPSVDDEATAIFVNAHDTNPLAANPTLIINEQPEAFALGLDLLAGQTDGLLQLCVAPGAEIPQGDAQNVQRTEFAGPLPAWLTGTHGHFLHGASVDRPVWTIGYQDVIAIGRLFLDGELWSERVVALAGPQVEQPRLLRTRMGGVVKALRDDEERVRFLGYPVEQYKLLVFVASAAIAGLAGALYVPQVGIINPGEFQPLNSIEIAIWVAVGGRGTLYGPIWGAVIIAFAESLLTAAFPEVWLFALGALFLLVTLLAPSGLAGMFNREPER